MLQNPKVRPLVLDQLKPLHKNIIAIAISIREKQHRFDMISLLEKCTKKLPNSQPEIEQAIMDLYEMKFFIQGRHLIKSDLLLNEKRKLIYKYILENPGAHEREIRKVFNLGDYETHVHLAYLLDYGFIRRNRYRNRNVHFVTEFDEKDELKILLFKNETTKKIYELISSFSRLRLSEISEKLNMPHSTIQAHLAELIDSNLIVKREEDSSQYYLLQSAPIQEKTVQVKSEYDYVGGRIRFKVAVRNFTETAIHNISLTLNPSEQYVIDNPIQKIANLSPNATRGVDYYLIPLSCGQSKVYGAISYENTYGNVNTQTIEPKEISIKCPLVIPHDATQPEIDTWINNLKKGTNTINYHNISDKDAFRIGQEQVSALDLSQITVNSDEKWALYSGEVKISGKPMAVKVSIMNPNIILDVWTDDFKQTTGFLAYLTNLINNALEIAYKSIQKTNDIIIQIGNLIKICGIADQTFKLCTKFSRTSEIIINLSNIRNLIQKTIPDSELLPSLTMWESKLQGIDETDYPLESIFATKLRFEILEWLQKIQEQIKSYRKIYIDAFEDLNQASEDILKGINLINNRIEDNQKIYGIEILSYLLVLDKKSGITIYEKDLGNLRINPDLVGGFLHALQSFGLEFAATENSMKTLTYEGYHFQIETGSYIRAALIIRGTPNPFLISRLSKFVSEFEQDYKEHLIIYTGNTTPFISASKLFESIFR